jgi:hypothetical protein
VVSPQFFFFVFNSLAQKVQKNDLHLTLIDVWLTMVRKETYELNTSLAAKNA